MPEKLDLKRKHKNLYAPPSKEPTIVDVPEFTFLMLDGKGEPGSPAFVSALQALYTASYKAKFACKKAGKDYLVPPLEGLWWADDMTAFLRGNRKKWQWTLMIRQPEVVPDRVLKDAVAAARDKVGAAAEDLRVEAFREGLSAQITHVGPFSAEGPTINALHEHIAKQGGKLRGKHHEIYVKDFRRTAPERLKTVLRQSFKGRRS